MDTPLVSVVSPCYNGESYVTRFLESLLNQTYSNIQFIFVNDGSKDKTEEIFNSYVEKLKTKFAEVKYIYQENGGVAEAINNALQFVEGEFITWPDSDDILYPECIEKKVKYLLENPGCGGVVTRGKRVLENDIDCDAGILMIPHSEPSENLFERLLFEQGVYYCTPAGFMFRTDALFSALKGKIIYSSPTGQNWQMMLPLAYHYKFGFLDEVLFGYLVRDNSHSRKEKSYEDNIKKTYLHEDCLVNTIKTIDMAEDEKKRLFNELEIRYIRKRLDIANQFAKKEDINSYFEQLRERGSITRSDIVIKRCANIPIYNLYFKMSLKPKIIIKRMLKNVLSR